MAASNDLLFGLLALQNGLIDQDALLAAFRAWNLDKKKTIADHLVARGGLNREQREYADAMMALHLKMHGGSAETSLARLTIAPSTREGLIKLVDPDIHATLSHVGSGTIDPEIGFDRTTTHEIGSITSEGVRFRVLRPHARGGLGAVFVALDTELPREVALKQILDNHADDPTSRQRFLLEAEITGGLEHPGIVPVYGLGNYADGRPFYAMRFVRGDNLKEAIERFHSDETLKRDPSARPLALRKLLRRFMDVCNAIDYAHGRGVLHRDIKPGNIIVGKHGETLVVDWGLAKVRGQSDGAEPSEERPLQPSSASGSAETLPGSAIGTPSYMSPEQARGDLENLGPQSDVYSLGATLYCLLTGRPPFAGSDLGSVLRAVIAGEFPRPRSVKPGIDRALEAVCLKAMSGRPQDRYPSARALADDIERWIADEAVTAFPEPLSARAARWARRNRGTVATVGLSLATAVVLLSVLYFQVSAAQRATARALTRVEVEQGRTKTALIKADANFRRARKAVEDYFTIVSEDVLLDEPGMQPLRSKLLQSAMDYHRQFFEERKDDPTVEAELAESHRRIGSIRSLVGNREEALPHIQEAIRRYRALSLANPDREDFQAGLAQSVGLLGSYFTNHKGGRKAAVAAFREEIAILENLLKLHPSNVRLQQALAESLSTLGQERANQRGGTEEGAILMKRARDLLRKILAEKPDSLRNRTTLADISNRMYGAFIGDHERQEEALKSASEALDLYREIIVRLPDSPRYRHTLGEVLQSRGLIYLRLKRYEESLRDLAEARTVLSKLARSNPGVAVYEGELGKTCYHLGNLLMMAGANEESLEPLRAAIETLDRYLIDHPDDLIARQTAVASHSALGGAFGGLGRYAESIPSLRRGVELSEKLCEIDPTNHFLQGELMALNYNLALSLNWAENHREAVAAFDKSRAIARETFGSPDWTHEGSNPILQGLARAYSLREIGRVEEAESYVARVRNLSANNAGAILELAKYDARTAMLLDQAGGPASKVTAIKDRVMRQLRSAKWGGSDLFFFRSTRSFDALRDRPDFQELMIDLAFPNDPFVRERLSLNPPES